MAKSTTGREGSRGALSAWFRAAIVLSGFAAIAAAYRRSVEAPEVVWSVPTDAELVAALGSLEGLTDEQQRLLSPKGHEVKRPPGPSDWLARHWEAGQSYTDFVGSTPNRPDASRRKLYIQPLGPFGEEHLPVLRQVADFGQQFFGLDAEIQSGLPLPDSITRRTREPTGSEQFLTTEILAFLEEDLPVDAYCRIGVTMSDLFPDPARSYVFGPASLHERVGVYSFARYDRRFFGESPEPRDDLLFLRRCLWVFSHEVGHMCGLPHCTHYECLMNGSNNLRETDSHSPHLCPICLRKLDYAVGVDPVRRYEAIARFYEEHALTDEARWIRTRLLWIKDGIESAGRGTN